MSAADELRLSVASVALRERISMSASRKRPKGAFRRPFGLVMSCVIMMPTSVGHQDLAALIARQPAVAERGRQHIRATGFATLHTATFSFPRPIGTHIPDAPGYQLASLDPRALDVTGSINGRDPFPDPFAPRTPPPAPQYEFPVVNRSLKGDLLAPRERQPDPAAPRTKPDRTRDHAAPVLSAPETIPAVSVHEPFAIPQAYIAEAARIHARRLSAERAAQAAQRRADAELLRAGAAEPFAISQDAIVAAQRIAAERETADAREARIAAARTALPQPAMPDQGEPFAIAAEIVADAERAAALRTEPSPVAAVRPQPAAKPDIPAVAYPAITAWAQPAAEPFGVGEDIVAESERIASARLAPVPQPATDTASAEPEEDSEAGEGIAVVENNEILTDEEPRDADSVAAAPEDSENPAMKMAKLYFGAESFGRTHGGLEAYGPGEAPTPLAPGKIDPDIKLSALTPPAAESDDVPPAKFPGKTPQPNETIAPKGEVTGEGKRPRTPAERLGLSGASRAKNERCLANAIYFESRGEEERGQKAVAQVVMNRVFSPDYPDRL